MDAIIDHAVINHKGRLMRGRRRRDGWTVERRALFLDMLAATGSVQRAEAAAGMSKGQAARLRGRDAEFAELWAQALEAGYLRLEHELLAHALGEARSPDNPGPERAEPPAALAGPFDPQLAIQVLRLRGRSKQSRAKKVIGPVDPVEVEAALMRKLADMARKMGLTESEEA